MLQYLKTKIYNIYKIIEVAQQKRADYWILHNLSDRELRDLGIGRSQIRELVYGDVSGTSRC